MNNLKKIQNESNSEFYQMKSIEAWIVAGLLPLFANLSSLEMFVWGGYLVVGGLLAKGNSFRWIAMGWIVSILFPPTSLLLITSSGIILKSWSQCVYATLLGFGMYTFSSHKIFLNTGILFILVAFLPFFWRRNEAL